MIKIILCGFAFLALSSCKKKDDVSGGLTVTMSPTGAYALSPDIQSCAQISGIDPNTTASIKGRRIVFGKPVFTWSDTARYLAIDQIVLVFNNSYLANQVFAYENIDLAEFRGILGGTAAPTSANTPGWDENLSMITKATDTGGATVVKSKCEVRIGGLTVQDKAPSFRAQGQMKIYGRSVELDGTGSVVSERPLFTQVSVYFDYTSYN